MQQKNCRVKKCWRSVVVLGIEVSDGKIFFASSSRELLERCYWSVNFYKGFSLRSRAIPKQKMWQDLARSNSSDG
jgi:hypothetical protein